MNKRFDQLDSIRGLASLSVFSHHLLLAYPVLPFVFSYSPARILVGGHQAVILFFILSGFCLSLPFLSGNRPAYLSYITKRVFRIYIPYLISLSISIFAAYQLHDQGKGQLRSFFYSFWQSGFDLKLITAHLTLLSNFNTYAFNTVVWSLIHEMRISLFFPFIMLFIIKRRIVFNLAICFVLIVFSALNDIFQFETSRGFHTTFFDTIFYTSFFIVGALAAKHREFLIEVYWNLKKSHKWIVFGVAAFLYTYSRLGSILLPGSFNRVFDDYSIAVGAIVFIIMALASTKVLTILNQRSITFLGKISYSLYLYHFLVMLIFAYTLKSVFPSWIIAIFSVAISFIMATISYFAIEKPSIWLGRVVSNKMVDAQNKLVLTFRRSG